MARRRSCAQIEVSRRITDKTGQFRPDLSTIHVARAQSLNPDQVWPQTDDLLDAIFRRMQTAEEVDAAG